jgi:small subunit ribosomal protein S25e
MAKKEKVSKAKQAASKSSKAGKKKWSKGKSKEKTQRAVIYEGEGAHTQALKEISGMRLVTAATVVERLKVNASLARRTINQLVAEGKLKAIAQHSSCAIYTRADIEEVDAAAAAAAAAEAEAAATAAAATDDA